MPIIRPYNSNVAEGNVMFGKNNNLVRLETENIDTGPYAVSQIFIDSMTPAINLSPGNNDTCDN
jgi:hypothetical protein